MAKHTSQVRLVDVTTRTCRSSAQELLGVLALSDLTSHALQHPFCTLEELVDVQPIAEEAWELIRSTYRARMKIETCLAQNLDCKLPKDPWGYLRPNLDLVAHDEALGVAISAGSPRSEDVLSDLEI